MTRCATIFVFLILAVAGISVAGPSSALAATGYSIEEAKVYVKTKNWNGLLAYAQGWTQVAPKDPDAWEFLGIAYGSKDLHIGLERPREALDAFRHAVTLKPVFPEVWNALGLVAREIGRYDEAIDALTRATQQAPSKANYWHNLAGTYAGTRKYSLALNALNGMERACRSDVEWYFLANDFQALGTASDPQLYSRAIGAYRRALQLNPRFAAAWNNMGATEQLRGNVQAALTDYQRASALGDPAGANNYNNLKSAIASSSAAAQPQCTLYVPGGGGSTPMGQRRRVPCTQFGPSPWTPLP